MQISDLVGQYSRNINQDISVAAPAPESQQLVDAVREMTAGQILRDRQRAAPGRGRTGFEQWTDDFGKIGGKYQSE